MEASEVVDDIFVDEFLSHFGTKGMKWGVRREAKRAGGQAQRAAYTKARSEGAGHFTARRAAQKTGQSAVKETFRSRRAERKMARGDKKFAKRVDDPRKNLQLKIDLHNATNKAMNEVHIPRINNKPVYKKAADDGTLLNDNHPTTKKYFKEYMDAYHKELNKEATKLGTNPSGTHQYKVGLADDFLGFRVGMAKVKHASPEDWNVKFERDDKGRIIGFTFESDTLEQSNIFVEDFLEHHGVKGMKWGVRRKATVGPQEVVISDKRKLPGFEPKLRARGGEGHSTSADATRARTIGRIGKKSGLKSLSDQELRDYSNRLQLEANVRRLNYNESNAGKRFVLRMLGRQGEREASTATKLGARQVRKHAARQGARALAKAGLMAAAA